MNQKLLLILPVFLFQHLATVHCQGFKTFQPTGTNFANPERGYYRHTETHTGNYSLLDEQVLRAYREDEHITQVLRVFYLSEFRETPISQAYLDNMRRDFLSTREAGLKVIIRFAYSQGTVAPFNDARPEIVMMHIDQLKPVIQEHADVIATWQAGFIGTWGEWYFTDHFAQSPGVLTEEDVANRKMVVDALLEVLPQNRTIQLRTPGYKMTLFDSDQPISSNDAFSGQDHTRVGHHNDCFVASANDFGTYLNPAVEKPYLEQETLYVPMGGETCALAPPYSDCPNSLEELKRFHWSYLNVGYNQQVLDEWANQGCIDEVELNLGYRHRLIEATYSTHTKPAGTFSLSLSMVNDGFANFYNERGFEVILRNSTNEYVYRPEVDPRKWPLNIAHEISIEAGLPPGMEEGSYGLYLNFPDPEDNLKDRPEYAVRLANEDIWVAELGYNDLGIEVSVASSNPADTYTGDQYFRLSALSRTNVDIPGADELIVSAGKRSIMLFWPEQPASLERLIERSENNGNFEKIAAVPGKATHYEDIDVQAGTAYTYRYQLVDAESQTPYSIEISASMKQTRFISPLTDGSPADWGAVPPLSTWHEGNEFKSARAFFGADSAYFLLNKVSNYKVYLDTDNNINSGAAGSLQGMDYLLENGQLLRYQDGWEQVKSITEHSSAVVELGVPFSDLANLGNNQVIRSTVVVEDTITLASQGQTVNTIYRELPPDLPSSFDVRQSGTLPQSRLVVSWVQCNTCLGYILERSVDGSDFTGLGDYPIGTTLIRDDDLENELTYYYRLATYNDLGFSGYSGVISGRTGIVLSLEEYRQDAVVYPNPTYEEVNFSYQADLVQIFDLNGKLLKTAQNVDKMVVSGLSPGIYLVMVFDRKDLKMIKLTKR